MYTTFKQELSNLKPSYDYNFKLILDNNPDFTEDMVLSTKEYLSSLSEENLKEELLFIIDNYPYIKNISVIRNFLRENYTKELITIYDENKV